MGKEEGRRVAGQDRDRCCGQLLCLRCHGSLGGVLVRQGHAEAQSKGSLNQSERVVPARLAAMEEAKVDASMGVPRGKDLLCSLHPSALTPNRSSRGAGSARDSRQTQAMARSTRPPPRPLDCQMPPRVVALRQKRRACWDSSCWMSSSIASMSACEGAPCSCHPLTNTHCPQRRLPPHSALSCFAFQSRLPRLLRADQESSLTRGNQAEAAGRTLFLL